MASTLLLGEQYRCATLQVCVCDLSGATDARWQFWPCIAGVVHVICIVPPGSDVETPAELDTSKVVLFFRIERDAVCEWIISESSGASRWLQ